MPIKESRPRESLRVPLATTTWSRSLASIEPSISGHALTISAGPPSSSFVVIVVFVVVVVVEKPSMLPEKENRAPKKTCTIRHRLKEQNFLLNRGPIYSADKKAQTKPPPFFPRGVYPPACFFLLVNENCKRKKRQVSRQARPAVRRRKREKIRHVGHPPYSGPYA